MRKPSKDLKEELKAVCFGSRGGEVGWWWCAGPEEELQAVGFGRGQDQSSTGAREACIHVILRFLGGDWRSPQYK